MVLRVCLANVDSTQIFVMLLSFILKMMVENRVCASAYSRKAHNGFGITFEHCEEVE